MTRQSEPRVGTGAAILQDGQILLLQRVRPPEAGCWGLPGGKVDLFETVAQAVIREVREELGIGIDARDLLCVVDQIDRAGGEHWIAPVYLVREFDGQPAIQEPEKHSGLAWFALDDLPTPLTESTRQAIAALQARR
ncbi:NUDIX hydrolase [Phenylobacterium deserti]|uniref:ADP-ribose pyrophosphatase n=1 Tax=Phenylobacterium deserti TaxID=1914756 RepID=A0A328AQ33_9CAUL|nr:NUDIX domain-containing protein [Phenylobacterium deserti]RAK56465.1 ADP-ribose pyrophosphatase [Phenylobacterium deserti]